MGEGGPRDKSGDAETKEVVVPYAVFKARLVEKNRKRQNNTEIANRNRYEVDEQDLPAAVYKESYRKLEKALGQLELRLQNGETSYINGKEKSPTYIRAIIEDVQAVLKDAEESYDEFLDDDSDESSLDLLHFADVAKDYVEYIEECATG